MCIFDEDINQVKDKVQLKIGSTPSSIIAQTKNLPAVKSDEQVNLSLFKKCFLILSFFVSLLD